VASASTISSTGDAVSYQTDLGETNDGELRLSDDGQQLVFLERSSNLAAGLGCTEAMTGEVTCPASGVTRAGVELGDNDDRFVVRLGSVSAPSVFIDGGDGTDLVIYTGTTPVSISLDNTANDGPEGRGDDIRFDVENVTGTDAADAITGSAGPNVLTGGLGADTYACGGGVDAVDGDKTDQVGPDCEIVARDSRVKLTNGNDKFKPFRPGLAVFGRRGNDILRGGPGNDLLSGDRGNDTIRVRGGKRDTVACGKGRDKVTADKKDKVSKDCEKVSRK
jgi:Ca2+-binding RTX toxin-like protein